MPGFTEKLYFASPIWLQQAAVALYGWRWYHRRFGAHFHRLTAEFKKREPWGQAQFREYQDIRLRQLIEHAWRSPYYSRAFRQAGLTETRTANISIETISMLPMLTKETLRSQGRQLLTSEPQRDVMVFKSSGTTGTPTEIYYTPEFHALELAIPEARNISWAGLSYRDRRVMFGVRKVCRYEQQRPPFWRFSPAENMAYASIYHLSPRFLPYYMEFLRQYQPAIIMGYPSALRSIAAYAIEHQDFPAPAKAIFTTSETVTQPARETIEAAWKCQIFDCYGAVENCMFASQCEAGRYHVSPDVGIIEIVRENGQPTEPGEMGEVICTGLHNELQPLIRYRIGDVARWASDQSCTCGRQMPILEAVEGRLEDICYTPDGRQMLRFDTVFKGVESIREAQVIQKALDHFVIRVVPTADFGEADVVRLQHNMHVHVGQLNVEVQTVESLPRTPAGKFRAVICNLPPELKKGS